MSTDEVTIAAERRMDPSGRMGSGTARTGDTLDEVGHHAAEVGPDVLEDVQLLLVLRLQEHAGQVHVLQEQGPQRQRVPLQRAVGAGGRDGRLLSQTEVTCVDG